MKVDHIEIAENTTLWFQRHSETREWRFFIRCDSADFYSKRTYKTQRALRQAVRRLIKQVLTTYNLDGWTGGADDGRGVMAELEWRDGRSYWVPGPEDRDPDLHRRAAAARARARGADMSQAEQLIISDTGPELAVLTDIRALLQTVVRQLNHLELALRDLEKDEQPVFPPLPWQEVRGASVETLPVCARTQTCLRTLNIRNIGELLKYSEAELLRTPNFGRKSLNELKTVLAEHGLQLGYPLD